MDELNIWDSALNQTLGRSLVATGNDQVLQCIIKEIAQQLAITKGDDLSNAIIPLQQALTKPDTICIENICVFGRKLCELLSAALIKHHQLKSSAMLLNNI